MAIIDVVKWDGTPDIFAYKFPENNLTTFTQLIVNESQEALLFHGGKLLKKFEAGRHVLSTANIPILENLFGIPFGGKNPFTAEVWFVNKVATLDMKWGTQAPMQLRDPAYNVMIPVRAHGQFGVKITNAEPFLVSLVGTLSSFNRDNLMGYFKGLLLSKASTIIAKKIAIDKISVLDISAQITDISTFIRDEIKSEFEKYGIEVLNFYVNSINIVEEDEAVVRLKKLLSKKAEMDILGYTYQQERSFNVLEEAAQNEGTAGTIMGAGMGIGMGFGVGGGIGNMMKDVGQTVQSATINCSKCQTAVPNNARFCPSCGNSDQSTPKADLIVCSQCKNNIPANSKFCPFCGDLYNPCPACGADNPKEALVCEKCKVPMPTECPKCNTKINGEAKFCPGCGEKVEKTCPKCNQSFKNTFKFCPNCGESAN